MRGNYILDICMLKKDGHIFLIILEERELYIGYLHVKEGRTHISKNHLKRGNYIYWIFAC